MKKTMKKMMTGGMANPNSPAKVSPKMKSGGTTSKAMYGKTMMEKGGMTKAMYGKAMKNGGSVLPKMKKGSGC
jgi:hypothetical protein